MEGASIIAKTWQLEDQGYHAGDFDVDAMREPALNAGHEIPRHVTYNKRKIKGLRYDGWE